MIRASVVGLLAVLLGGFFMSGCLAPAPITPAVAETAAVVLPAQGAGMECGEQDRVIANVATKYGERQIASGTIDRYNALAVYVSESGSFTMLILTGHGLACLLSAGEDWEYWGLRPVEPKPEMRDG